MKRCIAIGGIPGTGKTTLMKNFIGEVSELKQFRKLVNGHESPEYIVLGDYSDKEAVFSGSDKFSMAVQPEAEQFFVENTKNVVFEGDRIFNKKMLDFIQNQGYDLLVLILEAESKTLKERYEKRGSNQSEQFINGRKTKYENIKNDGSFPVYVSNHEIPDETKKIVEAMGEYLKTGKINPVFTKIEKDSLEDFFS